MTIKELSPYLSYGLQFKAPKDYNFGGSKNNLNKLTMCSLRTDENKKDWIMFEEVSGFHPLSNFTPIFRPLSKLIKKIKHGGKEFIPLYELFTLLDDCDTVNYFGNYKKPVYQIDDEWVHALSYGGVDGLCFSYMKWGQSFMLMIDGEQISISNQYELFTKLFQWHFNIFEL